MKKSILSILFVLFSGMLFGQGFSFNLTGNPVNTTGWNFAAQSSVNGDEFILTNALGSQAGYIYYNTPQNLSNCAQFTVSFSFRITNSSSPTADGIAFWYISNPPTGFTVGGGIGLPNNPNGLLLILDTYNNGGPNTNPKVSLRRLDGTSNYVEGSTTGQLAPDLVSQNFITDGNWHTCTLAYNFGTVTVAFDGNPPVMTGTTTLSINGYFGFSAGTGASWAKHAIKNVSVTGAPEPAPPVANDITYCQFAQPAPLTATGVGLKWYTTPTGGTQLPSAPTPSTGVPGTYTWYVSQAVPGCGLESLRDTLTVTVNPTPLPPVITVPKYCSGQQPTPITITTGTNVKWYDTPTGGTATATIPVVNTTAADTFTWYATQTNALGCESQRIAVTAIVNQSPQVDFTHTLGLACAQDTVHFQNTSLTATSYFWDFSDGYTDTAKNPVHIYQNQGSYSVMLAASNNYCSDTTYKTVTITHPLQALFTTSADTICQGGTIAFTNTSTVTTVNGIAPTYHWNFGDGSAVSTQQSPSHTFPAPGIYTVSLVTGNSIPCFDTMRRTVYVDSLPYVSFTRSDTAICMGDNIVFNATYGSSGLKELLWNFGDKPDLIADVNPATYSYDAPGVYTVTLNGKYRVCDEVSTTAKVTVKPMPTINIGSDTSICLDGTPFVIGDQVNAGNPLASWDWSTGDTTAAITIRHYGHYKARVTIDQCSTTDEIEVRKDCFIDMPNSFTPNGDGINDYFFPRQLLSAGLKSFKMAVFNRWGQKVFETESINGRGWDGQFNGKEQPLGVYIYQIDVVMKNERTETYTGNVTLLK
ncbi:PKD domain-containing protein [Taibaiella chishuiensis]|uniref:Gliding motility-associated-like protein n=1 Tax=Taibaiella chishuiensis TaxID=1434707 RepID=A0A2P8CVS0_9BACT|nr:PKD domain-containing protein [Taibaiella chishuiensis]PSK89055.1 gliding motility-associated-like protein [Taibaiella chishuiensis]